MIEEENCTEGRGKDSRAERRDGDREQSRESAERAREQRDQKEWGREGNRRRECAAGSIKEEGRNKSKIEARKRSREQRRRGA